MGYSDIVKLLIAAGASIDMQERNGITALMAAASNNNTEAVELLIAAGASVDVRDKD
jgi:uncharacterized protein